MKVRYFSSVGALPYNSVNAWAVDGAVASLWALPFSYHQLPAGEACKTREVKEKLEDALFSLEIDRKAILGAIGGGAACDLVGFTAATFMRGIRYILVPTTLLAMVDAAIGGKTAVNVSQGKNLLGAFHLPEEVWICPAFLSTLSDRELFCGYAEMVKMALLYDKEEAEQLLSCENLKEAITLERIQKAIACKISVITRDPKEKGERSLLNFGHTIGHAFESASNYQLAHGEAVWLGMVVEIFLSQLTGYMHSSTAERLTSLLLSRSKHLEMPSFDLQHLFSYMRKDKKNREKEIYSVLLTDVGVPYREVDWTHPVSEELIEKAIKLAHEKQKPYLL